MKIEKAIEILENDPPRPLPLNTDEYEEAYQLGIEALKDRLKRKKREVFPSMYCLPGETEE